jgi:subtilisin family serine protease
MPKLSVLACSIMVAAVLQVAIAAPQGASPAGTLSAVAPGYKTGELIVRFKNPVRAAKSRALHKATLMHAFGRLPLQHIRLPEGKTVQQALKEYRSDPDVLYAEPNYLVHKSTIPGDPLYPEQWHLPLISAPAAWQRSTGRSDSGSVLVAVLDTGIAYTHPDLISNLWTNQGELPGNGLDDDGNGIVDDYFGANFGGLKPGDPWDDDTADSHGTHVAGIIGATGNNGTGVAGTDWAVRLIAVKFLHGPEGYGELSDALKGMEYALSRGAKIINCSFEVAYDPSLGGGIQSLKEAVAAAEQAGALVVSAAGNGGLNLDTTDVYPASIRLANNIAVAAVLRDDTLAGYSNYGRHVVDLSAPGGAATGSDDAVLSTVWLEDGARLYRTTAGTSMSAPQVSGAAALIWNANPELTLYQVKARILNSVDRSAGYDAKLSSGGRLNLDRALTVGDLPTVFEVTPYRVRQGTQVTITGVNFGSASGNVSVGSLPATVSSWSDSSITALVPADSGDHTLQVNGQGRGFALVYPQVPVLAISANPAGVVAPGSAVFSLSVEGADSKIVKYEWDLGSGSFAEMSGVTTSVAHDFTAAGSYLIKARVTDDLDRTAEASLLYPAAGQSPSSSSGGGCFIATAAYGSYLHPKVAVLRSFRDHYLLTNAPGRAFAALYYRQSPRLAEIIARHEALKVLTRALLTPLIFAIEFPLAALSLLMLAVAAWSRNRKCAYSLRSAH